jgi:drug/metabolite transporter (DMT)-like permease
MNIARKQGIWSAIISALTMGVLPIFGKEALLNGFTPLAVVTLRTSIAAGLLLFIMVVFKRQFLYIFPVGFIGCALAGFINGLGSILYYSGLSRLDASIGHLLYSFYPLFVAFWLLLDRQTIHRLTIFRLILCVPGITLLVTTGNKQVDLVGACLMLGSAVLYALHLLINQRILYEVPAPTVTLYTLLSMSLTVFIAFILFKPALPPMSDIWFAILAMGIFTFLSRITLFLGVKHLGGIQTALLGLGELFVTVLFAQLYLGDRLSSMQWVGAGLLAASLLMIGFDRRTPERHSSTGWLSWLNPPNINPSDFPWQS